MSDMAAIRSALRAVVNDTLSDTVQYRLLTSNPDADTRTWGSWTDIVGLFLLQNNVEAYDDKRQEWLVTKSATLRIDDSVVKLAQGDQIKTADEIGGTYTIWAVTGYATGQAPGSTGTLKYTLEWVEGVLASGVNRGGGL